MVDRCGQLIGNQGGYYIDVTAGVQSDVTAAMESEVKVRALIEQVEGVLMAAYGVDADRAFEILRWRSQLTGVKLKDVASKFIEALAEAGLPATCSR
ncbi:ANTAR domain-containing protein [Mycolicibacterium mucogenicum]|nr:ANTAR domain-containing protein [Mycolicibacterium mucogenicum]